MPKSKTISLSVLNNHLAYCQSVQKNGAKYIAELEERINKYKSVLREFFSYPPVHSFRKHGWTWKNEQDKIRYFYHNGIRADAIARKFEISTVTVYNYAR